MTLLIVGTVPIEGFPLTSGVVHLEGDSLTIGDERFPCSQGTGAMLSAAYETADYLGIEPPHALLAGDIGDGKGSRLIYQHLIAEGSKLDISVLALHYLQPVMGLMKKLCESVHRSGKKPVMIADAGSMYAAKAAGIATAFDIFTPDSAEMAFLADEEATHPAYIRKHFFETGNTDISPLIESVYKNGNAPKVLLVKGSMDYVIKEGRILHTVDEPDIPEMEAIGGTGDTITGMVSAFISAGLKPHEAAIIAVKANRVAGMYAGAKPDTPVIDIVRQFKTVFRKHLCQWSGVCAITEGGYDD